MSKIKSLVLTTLFHGACGFCLWLMLVFSYIGANAAIPEAMSASGNQYMRTAYSLLTAVVNILGVIVMCYPIVNWMNDVAIIFNDSITAGSKGVLQFVKNFVIGGLNAATSKDKDTL